MFKSRQAYAVSVILIGVGVIFMLLPVFKVIPGKSEAFFFAGIMSFLTGFLMQFLKN